MKLREKFKKWLDTDPRKEIRDYHCESICDLYAINFAEWLNENNYFDAIILDRSITTELLHLYKKEKGL